MRGAGRTGDPADEDLQAPDEARSAVPRRAEPWEALLYRLNYFLQQISELFWFHCSGLCSLGSLAEDDAENIGNHCGHELESEGGQKNKWAMIY